MSDEKAATGIAQSTAMRLPAPESVELTNAPSVLGGNVVQDTEDPTIDDLPPGTPITVRKEEFRVILAALDDAQDWLEQAEKLCDEDDHRALLTLLREGLAAVDEGLEMADAILDTVLQGANATFSAPAPSPTESAPAPVSETALQTENGGAD